MAAKEFVVKKYVVRLSGGERSLLETLIRLGSRRRIELQPDLVAGHYEVQGLWPISTALSAVSHRTISAIT